MKSKIQEEIPMKYSNTIFNNEDHKDSDKEVLPPRKRRAKT